MQKLKDDPLALRRRVLDHIDDVLGATRGLCDEWDVLNEPFDNHDLMDVCGRDVMVEWFRRARAVADPSTRLYINDYGILASGGRTDTPHQAHYEDTIRFLIAQGAPFDGIGMQGHFGSQPTPPTTLWKILDRFAAFGKRIQVTEFDINTEDEDYQAAYTRDCVTALFAHPAVDGIVCWGFWEGAHWIANAAFYRRDWTRKPNGQAWHDLVRKTWWTNADFTTATDGSAAVRGFHGAYTVTVTSGDRSATAEATLAPGGTVVEVRVP
jgi:GH35 family endo-1,4-beta-xylanase